MTNATLDPFSLREVFHLEFLRRLGGTLDPKSYAVKGGVNMRLFFGSARYSEDIDIDLIDIPVHRLKSSVMSLLRSPSFFDSLVSYGIKEVRPPDLFKAKQTETTQRFKIHLITPSGEDFFTKIEFSRRGRGFRGRVAVDFVPDRILRPYRMTPLWVPHYDLDSTISQKIVALASRAAVQARDIFDLHILISRPGEIVSSPAAAITDRPGPAVVRKARDRVYEVGFEMFRDTVLSYLSFEDRKAYDRPEAWDDIRLRIAEFLELSRGADA
jgi:hypothetical protein